MATLDTLVTQPTAVSRLPPDGELDQVVGEDCGTWHTQVCAVRVQFECEAPIFNSQIWQSSIPSEARDIESCSTPPLSELQYSAAPTRWLVPVMAVIAEQDRRHRK